MISKTKCIIIGLLCISLIKTSHSSSNETELEQEEHHVLDNWCPLPLYAGRSVRIHCHNNLPNTCAPSYGYVPEFTVAEVNCDFFYDQTINTGNHTCRNKQWVPPFTECGVHPFFDDVNMNKKKLKKNATATALNYCKQYAQYKYVNYWKVADFPGGHGEWVNYMDCVTRPKRIVDGTLASPKEYPHMALIGYGTTFQTVQWLCGGSLISEKFILSAAHCASSRELIGPPQWVLLGDLNIRSTIDDARPAVYSIAKIHSHPKYSFIGTANNNIALFELNTTVALSPYVRPACLSTQTSKHVGELGIVTGWGRTDTYGQFSDHLMKATIKIHNDSLCETRFNSIGEYNSTTVICAGDLEGRKDTCKGDGGGPLQLPSEENCMWDILGVASFGDPVCGNREVPSVYTNVPYYLDWIQSIVWP